jgi:SNF2 family DNA or RNA helicase
VSSSGDVRNLKRKKPLQSASRLSSFSGKKRDRGSDSDLLEDTDEDIDIGKEIGKLSAKQEGNINLNNLNRGDKERMRKDREKEKKEEKKRKEEEEKDAYDSDVEFVENSWEAKINAEHLRLNGMSGSVSASADVFTSLVASPQTKERNTNVFKLSKDTIQANNDEKKRQKDFKAFKFFNDTNGFILNDSRPADEEAVGVVSTIVDRLKGHQKTGVRFLWRNLIHSFKEASKPDSGGGCVLAHCMGLGKTLTTICFTLTLLSAPQITAIKDPILVAEQLDVFIFIFVLAQLRYHLSIIISYYFYF